MTQSPEGLSTAFCIDLMRAIRVYVAEIPEADDPKIVIAALVDTLRNVLGHIECRDCRDLARQFTEQLFAAATEDAMNAPGSDGGHGHLH